MTDFNEANSALNKDLACEGCGAIVAYKPGTEFIECLYCGTKKRIAQSLEKKAIVETDLAEYLAQAYAEDETMAVTLVNCSSCGATSTLQPNVVADTCPFCAGNLVVKGGTLSSMHKPQYVLPFGFTAGTANVYFGLWLKKLWFAPNDLQRYADVGNKLNGMYLPYWTFDCTTESHYRGERGEHYYQNESYTAYENGKRVTRTRRVRYTEWHSVSGRVRAVFDDILIEASRSLPKHKLRALEPWDTKNLVPYDDNYLTGFRAENQVIDVKSAYGEARGRMQPIIQSNIKRDIGGDEQRVSSVDTAYQNPSFKHVLLPVWISAYRYNNKVYQIIINARTGQIQGERPYSAAKITLTVLGVLFVILLLFAL